MLNIATLFIGKSHIHLTQIDSTNTYAKQFIGQKGTDGLLITASFQTAGKGQGGNRWESEKNKNIIASLLVYPRFLLGANSFLLSVITSLAIQKALQALAPQEAFKIKWPNDIFAKQKKIAGILIETQYKANFIDNAIIGFGVNINQQAMNDLPYATSLTCLTGEFWNIERALVLILEYFENYYLTLKNNHYSILLEEYNQALLFKDQIQRFLSRDKKQQAPSLWEGSIRGLNAQGKLVVANLAGKEFSYHPDEIKLVIE
jgi:BirA family biotin operon repressor/biotin-[acetyl-CoA-carboxylase] ligase